MNEFLICEGFIAKCNSFPQPREEILKFVMSSLYKIYGHIRDAKQSKQEPKAFLVYVPGESFTFK